VSSKIEKSYFYLKKISQGMILRGVCGGSALPQADS
jgi:hypothetical protein